jgi:hypothetical protein
VTTEKTLAKEPAVAPGVTPEFLANRAKVIAAALGTIPANTISRDVVGAADADNVDEDFEPGREQ